jgi:hypothetical protein
MSDRAGLSCANRILLVESAFVQDLIHCYGDRCRQANLEVHRSVSRSWAASRSAGDACTLSMSDRADLSFANRIYWSIQRPSVRTSFTVTVIDACRRILQSNDQFLVQRKAASRSGGDACTLGSTLGMSGIVLICRAQIVYPSSERPSGSYPTLR